ncbi:hypothetical protein [Arcanobacterium phocae]|uniref:hypothetical protein n=1 Tax=Arcanobacterium phocae TaxID=131112 RepID=UPI001C0EFB49|nr:hypothetical protein [Arcanobacterium phocae]
MSVTENCVSLYCDHASSQINKPRFYIANVLFDVHGGSVPYMEYDYQADRYIERNTTLFPEPLPPIIVPYFKPGSQSLNGLRKDQFSLQTRQFITAVYRSINYSKSNVVSFWIEGTETLIKPLNDTHQRLLNGLTQVFSMKNWPETKKFVVEHYGRMYAPDGASFGTSEELHKYWNDGFIEPKETSVHMLRILESPRVLGESLFTKSFYGFNLPITVTGTDPTGGKYAFELELKNYHGAVSCSACGNRFRFSPQEVIGKAEQARKVGLKELPIRPFMLN